MELKCALVSLGFKFLWVVKEENKTNIYVKTKEKISDGFQAPSLASAINPPTAHSFQGDFYVVSHSSP